MEATSGKQQATEGELSLANEATPKSRTTKLLVSRYGLGYFETGSLYSRIV